MNEIEKLANNIKDNSMCVGRLIVIIINWQKWWVFQDEGMKIMGSNKSVWSGTESSGVEFSTFKQSKNFKKSRRER